MEHSQIEKQVIRRERRDAQEARDLPHHASSIHSTLDGTLYFPVYLGVSYDRSNTIDRSRTHSPLASHARMVVVGQSRTCPLSLSSCVVPWSAGLSLPFPRKKALRTATCNIPERRHHPKVFRDLCRILSPELIIFLRWRIDSTSEGRVYKYRYLRERWSSTRLEGPASPRSRCARSAPTR